MSEAALDRLVQVNIWCKVVHAIPYFLVKSIKRGAINYSTC
jgi:hypothetical protein